MNKLCHATERTGTESRRIGAHAVVSLILIAMVIVLPSSVRSSAIPSIPPSPSASTTVIRLRDWVEAKCGSHQPNQHPQLWSYEGSLYDPLDGRKLAHVHGLEQVYCVSDCSNDQDNDFDDDDAKSNRKNSTSVTAASTPSTPVMITKTKKSSSRTLQQPRPYSFQMDSVLNHPNATYDDAVTLVSQKVFCYTNINNQSQILKEIRVRPYARSPKKRIPLNQAVALYETATTYVTRNKKKRTKNLQQPKNQQQKSLPRSTSPVLHKTQGNSQELEWLVHTEFPNGDCFWSTASTSLPSSSNDLVGKSDYGKRGNRRNKDKDKMSTASMEWTLFTKRRSRHSRLFLPDLTRKPKPTYINSNSSTKKNGTGQGPDAKGGHGEEEEEEEASIAPKRAALIQFGMSRLESKNKFGARETYAWSGLPYSTVLSSETSKNRLLSLPSLAFWKRKSNDEESKNVRNRGTDNSTSRSKRRNNEKNAFGNASLRYTRYGEGPPFYAPGRMCMLELHAKKIDTLDQASSVIVNVLKDHVHGWWNDPFLPTTSRTSTSATSTSTSTAPSTSFPATKTNSIPSVTMPKIATDDRTRAACNFRHSSLRLKTIEPVGVVEQCGKQVYQLWDNVHQTVLTTMETRVGPFLERRVLRRHRK